MRTVSWLCMVVLTSTTERGDAIVEVGSGKIVSGLARYDDIISAAVTITMNIKKVSICDGCDDFWKQNALTRRRCKKFQYQQRLKRYYSQRVAES